MFVEIFGTEVCPYCIRAKNTCIERNIEYIYKFVGKDITKEDLIKRIGKEVKTVPQIFVDEKYIGGCDDFLDFLNRKIDIEDDSFGDMEI